VNPTFLRRWDLFCKVVDNYGDVGWAWRLARQLCTEYGFSVRLWLDDFEVIAKLTGRKLPWGDTVTIAGVEIRRWSIPFAEVEPADVIVECFACGLPETYVERMARQTTRPAWIVMEYLSAESWVNDVHGRPSRHPRLGMDRYYFAPGFVAGTGGLLCESRLQLQCGRLQRDAQRIRRWWQALGLDSPAEGEFRMSLFCYPGSAVAGLFDVLADDHESLWTVVVPGPDSLELVRKYFGWPLSGTPHLGRRGSLSVLTVPFLRQRTFDHLLWVSDINFVRGEDSWIRAHWAGKPFVWQPYRQADGAHELKLEAFLSLQGSSLTRPASDAIAGLFRAWNVNSHDLAEQWQRAWRHRQEWLAGSRHRADELAAKPDLSARLVDCALRLLKYAAF